MILSLPASFLPFSRLQRASNSLFSHFLLRPASVLPQSGSLLGSCLPHNDLQTYHPSKEVRDAVLRYVPNCAVLDLETTLTPVFLPLPHTYSLFISTCICCLFGSPPLSSDLTSIPRLRFDTREAQFPIRPTSKYIPSHFSETQHDSSNSSKDTRPELLL